jgi:hypothetical protein
MVDGKGKAWHRRNDYTAPPTSIFAVSPDYAIDQGVANFVLNLNVVYGSTIYIKGDLINFVQNKKALRCDEELVLDIDKVF